MGEQFCLRWNNHQSTVVSVVESLLNCDSLTDCTLAAEGKCLKAHKLILTACSPYFEALLCQQHHDKHPIFILKDVKFYELKAMLDYMYKGEVNISQDRLDSFIKTAESLQIKGLTDQGGGGGGDCRDVGSTGKRKPGGGGRPESPQAGAAPAREGSPLSKRRRRGPHSSGGGGGGGGHSSSSTSLLLEEAPSTPAGPDPARLAVVVPKSEPPDPAAAASSSTTSPPPPPPHHHHQQHHQQQQQQLLLAPPTPVKSELLLDDDEEEEETTHHHIEDLTLDDDDDEDYGGGGGGGGGPPPPDTSQPGTSFEGNSQASQDYSQWQMTGDRSTDEVFMAAQEAINSQSNSQDGEFQKWLEQKTDLPTLDTLGKVKVLRLGRVMSAEGEKLTFINHHPPETKELKELGVLLSERTAKLKTESGGEDSNYGYSGACSPRSCPSGDPEWTPVEGRRGRAPEERRRRKKEQNRGAALRYRMRKKVLNEGIEGEEKELRRVNTELRHRLSDLAKESAHLKSLIRDVSKLKKQN